MTTQEIEEMQIEFRNKFTEKRRGINQGQNTILEPIASWEVEEWLEDKLTSLTSKHQEEIEKAVEAERERIRAFVLRETTVTLDSGVGIAKPEYQFGQKVIQALTPTKTDKQTEV